MKTKIVGISGLAGSGKDLFFNALSAKINAKRFALADELKSEVRIPFLNLYGIDVLNCSRADKEVVRPALVSHGSIRRNQTNGRYWIDKLNNKIKADVFSCFLNGGSSSVCCVTDIRHDSFEKDEVHWLKNEMHGVLVHISKFKVSKGKKIFTRAPNEEEASQNPKLINKADYVIEWEHAEGNKEEVERFISPIINDFIKWISN